MIRWLIVYWSDRWKTCLFCLAAFNVSQRVIVASVLSFILSFFWSMGYGIAVVLVVQDDSENIIRWWGHCQGWLIESSLLLSIYIIVQWLEFKERESSQSLQLFSVVWDLRQTPRWTFWFHPCSFFCFFARYPNSRSYICWSDIYERGICCGRYINEGGYSCYPSKNEHVNECKVIISSSFRTLPSSLSSGVKLSFTVSSNLRHSKRLHTFAG